MKNFIARKSNALFPHTWRMMKMVNAHKSNVSFGHHQKRRELIICFDGTCLNGGLVDRLKGIISAYHFALQYQFDFYIYFVHPFPLATFMKAVPERLYNAPMNWNPLNTAFIHAIDKPDGELVKTLSKGGNQKVFLYCNQDYLKNHPAHQIIWQRYFKELFRPSELLQNALQQQNISSYQLAFHTRFTSLLGDFKDITNEVLSIPEQEQLKEKVYQQIVAYMEQYEVSTATIFSDSISFLNDVKQKSNRLQVTEGMPSHIEHQHDSETALKSFVDFLLLSRFEKVCLIQTGNMFPSSFGYYASILENHAFEKVVC